jgi:hypothetical protein
VDGFHGKAMLDVTNGRRITIRGMTDTTDEGYSVAILSAPLLGNRLFRCYQAVIDGAACSKKPCNLQVDRIGALGSGFGFRLTLGSCILVIVRPQC